MLILAPMKFKLAKGVLIRPSKFIVNKNHLLIGLILLIICISISQCKPRSTTTTINIFAAASLADLLYKIEAEYESENKTIDLHISYGGSNLLAQQIIKGAPADLFMPAGIGPLEVLNKEIKKNHQIYPFISNELVLVLHPDTQLAITDISELATVDVTRFAIADPKLAPAGEYSKAVLENYNLWEFLKQKLILAQDVRTTLTYVSSGNAEIGIVYATDAISKPELSLIKIPVDSYPKIEYPIILINSENNGNEIKNLIDYLLSEKTKSPILKYGFTKIEHLAP